LRKDDTLTSGTPRRSPAAGRQTSDDSCNQLLESRKALAAWVRPGSDSCGGELIDGADENPCWAPFLQPLELVQSGCKLSQRAWAVAPCCATKSLRSHSQHAAPVASQLWTNYAPCRPTTAYIRWKSGCVILERLEPQGISEIRLVNFESRDHATPLRF
jgi:hypothetical protein